MKNLNTTLLIITTLIAVFFFGKWVNEVRPRYEWIETYETSVYDEWLSWECDKISTSSITINYCYFEDNDRGERLSVFHRSYFYANNCNYTIT